MKRSKRENLEDACIEFMHRVDRTSGELDINIAPARGEGTNICGSFLGTTGAGDGSVWLSFAADDEGGKPRPLELCDEREGKFTPTMYVGFDSTESEHACNIRMSADMAREIHAALGMLIARAERD